MVGNQAFLIPLFRFCGASSIQNPALPLPLHPWQGPNSSLAVPYCGAPLCLFILPTLTHPWPGIGKSHPFCISSSNVCLHAPLNLDILFVPEPFLDGFFPFKVSSYFGPTPSHAWSSKPTKLQGNSLFKISTFFSSTHADNSPKTGSFYLRRPPGGFETGPLWGGGPWPGALNWVLVEKSP